jgi:hypothetical protein
MKTYEIKIKSICAMIHHGSQSVGMQEKSMKKQGGDALTGNPDEWKQTIYYKDRVGVYLPAICFEACVKNAAKQFKIGRATAMKYVDSGLFCSDEYLSFLVNGKPIMSLDDTRITIDKRTVKNPTTKGRNVRYRAKFDEWESTFRIIVSADDYLSEKLLQEIITYGGSYVGVGDYRPKFGRFQLLSLKEVTNA